jgi:AcrR family transcriptional regulator
VSHAIRLADEGGLEAVSIRAVAKGLGRTPMALYTYVPSRAELVDLICDEAHGKPAVASGRASWEAALASWCAGLFAVYRAHPWLLRVSWARPILGPNEQHWLEALLVVLDRGHVDVRRRRAMVTACYSLVRSTGQAAADQLAAASATGESDVTWWTERSEAMAEIVPEFRELFPRSVALAADDAPEERAAWEDAPERVLRDAVRILLDGLR